MVVLQGPFSDGFGRSIWRLSNLSRDLSRPVSWQKYLADALSLSNVVQELKARAPINTFVFLVNDLGLDEIDSERVTD